MPRYSQTMDRRAPRVRARRASHACKRAPPRRPEPRRERALRARRTRARRHGARRRRRRRRRAARDHPEHGARAALVVVRCSEAPFTIRVCRRARRRARRRSRRWRGRRRSRRLRARARRRKCSAVRAREGLERDTPRGRRVRARARGAQRARTHLARSSWDAEAARCRRGRGRAGRSGPDRCCPAGTTSAC